MRLRSGSGTVTVLVDGLPCDDVSVTVGGRTLSAENSDVEAVRVVHGAPIAASAADDIDALRALVRRAGKGEDVADEIEVMRERIEASGDAEARTEGMVVIAMMAEVTQ